MDSGSSRRSRAPGVVTPNACTECRKKRTKCDGRTPCARCASQNVNCAYEVPLRQTKEDMRSEIEYLREHQQQSMRIFDALALGNHSTDILDQLRNGVDLENISRNLGSSISASVFDSVSYSPSQSKINFTPADTETSATHHLPSAENWYGNASQKTIDSARVYGQQVILGDESDSKNPLSQHGPKYHNEGWTTVTSDGRLVEHLLALYFCWEYPIFATVSKEHFMEDFRKGNPRYCSSLLVNALLALACRFSDRPSTRSDMDDSTTAGDTFFGEAMKLLKAEYDHHNLTTIQALGVMSIREASCGRISESSFLSTQSIRIAIEMGLHVIATNAFGDEEDDMERAVREATFWGALSLNEMLSLCTGTLPHLSRHIKFPDKPVIIDYVEEALWIPYTDDGVPLDHRFEQPSNLRSVYKTFCELSERVHNALHTLYSPGFKVSSREVIVLYKQYIQWYDTIPESLRLGHNFTPAVLFAHLFYHSSTLLLFQPFIDFKFGTSSVIPREVCYQAADAISGIVKSYSELYTLRRTPSFVPYFVLISTLIYLVALKNDLSNVETRQKLHQGITDLENMAKCHGFASRAIVAIKFLARRWSIEVHSQVEDSEELIDIDHRSSTASDQIPDHFSPDISILQTLQSIQPVLALADSPRRGRSL